MPPKAKITKEQVVKAAAEIVRERGAEHLTAKSLAAKLGCSTQPIFWIFSSMDEVRSAVSEYALQKFDEYIKVKQQGASDFKSIGLGYVRFAAEETGLFKLLLMSDNGDNDIISSHIEKKYVIKVIEETEVITGKQATDIYEEMWLFSHGIATMIATGTAKFSQERINEMFSDVFRGLINNIKMNRRTQND